MAETPKTIQIYLPEGEPRGIRYAEITSRTVQAVAMPRSKMDTAAQWPEIRQVGIYFLFGDDNDSSKPVVYIGEAESCIHRLNAHHEKKDFWHTAIVIVSKTHAFTKAHVKYLEHHCIAQCAAVGRFTLENSHAPAKPSLPSPMHADVMDAYENMSILLSALGYPLFEPLHKHKPDEEVFLCQSKRADARAIYNEDGMTVLIGSKASLILVPSMGKSFRAKRDELIAAGILIEENDYLVFKEDKNFSTPSAAADMVLGTPSSGWVAWKDKNGETLDALKRQISPFKRKSKGLEPIQS